MWAWLNLNVGLRGKRAKFTAAKRLNGPDVWRRIVAPFKPNTVSKRVELHTEVHAPGRCSTISELPDHLEKWQRVFDEFILMGGNDIPDEEKCVVVLKQLPADPPASMAMAFEEYRGYEDLKANSKGPTDYESTCLLPSHRLKTGRS